MMIPSNELACRALFYHAASDGRAQALFGPDWVKARWRAAVLQNAKCYCRAWAGVPRQNRR